MYVVIQVLSNPSNIAGKHNSHAYKLPLSEMFKMDTNRLKSIGKLVTELGLILGMILNNRKYPCAPQSKRNTSLYDIALF